MVARFARGLALALAVLVAAPSAHADLRPFGPPKASYRADSRLVADGQVIEAHLIAAGTHERREMTVKGLRQALIIDHGRGTALMLFPSQRMAMDVPVEVALGGAGGSSIRWTTTALGPQTVGGIATTRHRVVGSNARGMRIEGLIWLTVERIPLRAELQVDAHGRRYAVTQELRNLRIGPVDAALFRIPPGFARVSLDQAIRRR